MSRGQREASAAEVIAAVMSTGVAAIATYARSGGLPTPTVGTLLFMTLGFTGIGIARSLGPGDPRAPTRTVMAGGAFVGAAALFLKDVPLPFGMNPFAALDLFGAMGGTRP
jgi:hypothetical protein